jgi:hypothetical protein
LINYCAVETRHFLMCIYALLARVAKQEELAGRGSGETLAHPKGSEAAPLRIGEAVERPTWCVGIAGGIPLGPNCTASDKLS